MNKFLILTVLFLSISGINSAYATIANGAVTDAEEKPALLEKSSVSVQQAVNLPADATFINFDDTAAPCLFNDATALTDHYAATYGVTFAGSGGNDGGAVINECGNFGVSGQSSPNFLAFNTKGTFTVQMSDGGFPIGPESIYFTTPVGSVFVNAGSINTGTVTLKCYNTSGGSVGSDTITATDALQHLTVRSSSVNISRCEITFTGTTLVVDDLAFSSSTKAMPWIKVLLL